MLSGDPEEIMGLFRDWMPDNFPCCNANCNNKKAELVESIDPGVMNMWTIFQVTAHEAFSAMQGLGLPEERDCGPTAVKAAFEKPVKDLAVRLVKGTNRSVIDHIEFDDGTRLYLGASAYGAIVYRIAPKRSFVEEVIREQG